MGEGKGGGPQNATVFWLIICILLSNPSEVNICAYYQCCYHHTHHTLTTRQDVPAVFGGQDPRAGLLDTMACPPLRMLQRLTEIFWLCPKKPQIHCSQLQAAFDASLSTHLCAGQLVTMCLALSSRSRHGCQRVLGPVWGEWGQRDPCPEGVQQVQQV